MFNKNTEVKEIRQKIGLDKLSFIWWTVGILTTVLNSAMKNKYKELPFIIIAFVIVSFLASSFINFYIKQKLKKV